VQRSPRVVLMVVLSVLLGLVLPSYGAVATVRAAAAVAGPGLPPLVPAVWTPTAINRTPVGGPPTAPFAPTRPTPGTPATPSAAAQVAALTVPAADGLGKQRFYPLIDLPLTDRMQLHVNVSSGNLILEARDVAVKGTGLDLAITRYYNSRSTDLGSVGQGWTLDTGRDVGLLAQPGGGFLFYGPSGFRTTFAPNGSGGYTAPTGSDATLTAVGGAYTLKFHQSEAQYQFTGGGMLTALTDRNGSTITDRYNSANQLASITDTQGRVTTTGAYGASGFITALNDPGGRQYQYAYTGNYLTGYTDPATRQTTYAYDAAGNLSQITDPLGNVTTLAYDGDRRVTSIIRVDNPTAGTGPTTTFTYNAGATPNTVVTDANNHTTTHYYDTVGRVTKTVDANGKATNVAYTANSNVQQFSDRAGQITTYGYDSNDNRTSAQLPTGATTTWAYTNASHPYAPTSQNDPQGNSVTYAYNTAGNRISATDGLATQNQYLYTYNGNGTLATATDPRGNTTSYGYDSYGNQTSATAPAPLGGTTLHYDGLSRLDYSIDGKGQQTTYRYDALDRTTQMAYQSGDNTTLAYDVVGNLTRLDDNAGTPRQTTFGYDRLNRQTSKTFLLPSDGTLTYAYDGVGNLTSFTDGGGTVTYAYTAVNLLQTLTEPGGFQTTFTHDDMYRRTGTAYPNGVTLAQAYDNAGRLTSIVGKQGTTTLTSFAYTYQNAAGADTGLRQRVTDQDGNTTSYGYDVLNRLTGAQTKDSGGAVTATYAYAYDGANNRTGQTINGATTAYGYNAANELTAAGATTYTFDTDGNQTGSSAGQALAYNTANQTTSITPAGGAALALGYTGGSQVQRVSAGGTGFQDGLLGLNRQIDSGGTTYYTRGPQGELLGQRTPAGRSYYLYDGLGSTAALTDSAGNVVNRYAYDPYGNVTASSGAAANPYRFGGAYGAYTDVATGLVKIGQRYYDPGLGRWTQRDPLGIGNAYAYVEGDPINRADPTGLFYTFNGNGLIGVVVTPDNLRNIGVGRIGSAAFSATYRILLQALGLAGGAAGAVAVAALQATAGAALIALGESGYSFVADCAYDQPGGCSTYFTQSPPAP